MNLNRVIVCGRLVRDPECKSLPSGSDLASFSLATNRVYKDAQDQRQEQTEYHNVVVFGKLAGVCSQYLRKGDTALVEGRIQTRSWEKDGAKQYRTEIVAEAVQFGTGGRGERPVAGDPMQEEWDRTPAAPAGGAVAPAGGAVAPARATRAAHVPRALNEGRAGAKTATTEADVVPTGIVYPDEEINPEDIPF